MKKIKFLALACAIVAGGAIAITSCSKKNSTKAVSNSASSKMDASVDLNTFVTTFKTNADGSKTITFAEPEDIELASEYLSPLQLKSATIPAGLYTINVTKAGVSTLDFNVSNVVELPGGGTRNPVPMGLYIAKREQTGCNGNPLPLTCLCGIGFRCGFSFSEQTPYLEQAYTSLVRTSQVTGIHLQFNDNNINWEAISNGL